MPTSSGTRFRVPALTARPGAYVSSPLTSQRRQRIQERAREDAHPRHVAAQLEQAHDAEDSYDPERCASGPAAASRRRGDERHVEGRHGEDVDSRSGLEEEGREVRRARSAQDELDGEECRADDLEAVKSRRVRGADVGKCLHNDAEGRRNNDDNDGDGRPECRL